MGKTLIVFALAALTGCVAPGTGPVAQLAHRMDVAKDVPTRLHWAEHGKRATGVLVAVTRGGSNAFRVYWSEVLVPLPPTALDGPAWTEQRVGKDKALAIAALPAFRHHRNLKRAGDAVWLRVSAGFVWILGTDPIVIGLPADHTPRLDPYSPETRYVGDGGLGERVATLVTAPPVVGLDDWTALSAQLSEWIDADEGIPARVITLHQPMTIDQALHAICADDLTRLGTTTTTVLRRPATTRPARRHAS